MEFAEGEGSTEPSAWEKRESFGKGEVPSVMTFAANNPDLPFATRARVPLDPARANNFDSPLWNATVVDSRPCLLFDRIFPSRIFDGTDFADQG
jgi:hypothetical protein